MNLSRSLYSEANKANFYFRHYKLQCYNDLGEAMERIVQQKTFQKKLENAVKDKKGRPLGEDLEELTNIVFEKLKEG